MMRRPGLALVAILLVAAAVVSAVVILRPGVRGGGDPAPPRGDEGLALLVVQTAVGPFAAVIGSTVGAAGALAIPTKIS
ncbi:MAG TPA: hypothetical protein VEC09_00930, partial [Actinomycetota bacterium]|nr:hypothetical protein [Actinomycetota bacterium]